MGRGVGSSITALQSTVFGVLLIDCFGIQEGFYLKHDQAMSDGFVMNKIFLSKTYLLILLRNL